MSNKRGPLTEKEKEYILANAGRLTPESIGKSLKRTVPLIRTFIEKHYVPVGAEGSEQAQKINIRQELRHSYKFARLSQEFTPEEMKFFEEEYLKYMTQFKGDVLPTEETQLFQVIKFDLLMSRNMISRQQATREGERLAEMLGKFLDKFDNDPTGMRDEDRAFVTAQENIIHGIRTAGLNMTGEYQKLHAEQVKLMNSLKGTRDQRIKDIESDKVSFVGLLKMLARQEVADREGRQMELMKMAAEKEYRRLGRLHTYADGQADSPILSADTIGGE